MKRVDMEGKSVDEDTGQGTRGNVDDMETMVRVFEEVYRDEIGDFIGAVRGGSPPRATGEDGLASQKILETIHHSSAHGGAVRIGG